MHAFNAAMREFRRPLALLAVAILMVQTLVAGLAPGEAARTDGSFAAGVLCHGNGDPGDPGSPGESNGGAAVHDCCIACPAMGTAALPGGAAIVDRLDFARSSAAPAVAQHIVLIPRAIRAGPSQAPPAFA